MRKAKSDRRAMLRQEDLRRFPLPPWAEWYEGCTGEVLFAVYGAIGGVMALRTAILIDARIRCAPIDGFFGPAGFHNDADGRWFRLDFDSFGFRRHSLRQVKQALRMMEGVARGQ